MTALLKGVDAARKMPQALALALAGVGFVLLWGLPTIVVPLASDQVNFALGARTVVNGGQLYGDFWDIKPPLIYLIYSVPVAIADGRMEAIRVLDLVNTALAMGAVYLLSQRLFGRRAAVFAAGLYGFTYLTWAKADGLAESESFMAAPLILAVFCYRPEEGRRGGLALALVSGVLLGIVLGLKLSALTFVLALPAAEILLRKKESWTLRGALARLACAAAGFLLVQGALAAYLAAGGVLGDYIDIQRNYTAPYSGDFAAQEGSHLRFVVRGTLNFVQDTPAIVVPAAAAVLFALYRGLRGGAYLMATLVALGVLSVWWQGKMFRYHWLVLFPLLAPLAGFAVDQVVSAFSQLPRGRSWAAWALLGGCLLLLGAGDQLIDTYDGYGNLAGLFRGSLTRREVEVGHFPEFRRVHELVDIVQARKDPDDAIYVWGFWPVVEYWVDGPSTTRFVVNNGLRADWAPASWRDELMADLNREPPRFIAVARGDWQPWLVGTSEASDEHLRDNFPELQRFIKEQYVLIEDLELFILYERRTPAATRLGP